MRVGISSTSASGFRRYCTLTPKSLSRRERDDPIRQSLLESRAAILSRYCRLTPMGVGVRLWIQFSVNASGVVDAGWSCQRQLFRRPLRERDGCVAEWNSAYATAQVVGHGRGYSGGVSGLGSVALLVVAQNPRGKVDCANPATGCGTWTTWKAWGQRLKSPPW